MLLCIPNLVDIYVLYFVFRYTWQSGNFKIYDPSEACQALISYGLKDFLFWGDDSALIIFQAMYDICMICMIYMYIYDIYVLTSCIDSNIREQIITYKHSNIHMQIIFLG